MTDVDQVGPEERRRNLRVNEDWLAVVVGLAVLALVLGGVLTSAWVP